MLVKIVFLLSFSSASLSFQIPSSNSGRRLIHASIGIQNRIKLPSTRSAYHLQQRLDHCRDNISLRTKQEEEDDDEYEYDEKEENEELSPIPKQQQPNIFESIWESPIFPSFLFWVSFVANPKLRERFANFVSKYLDLSIAIPVSVVGVVVVVTYVTYQNQLLDIELASGTTEESLTVLRGIRKAQMTASGGDTIEKEYESALENYEYTLKKELKLRNTFIMLPWKIPNASPEGPDRAAAKQFLGMEIDESGDLIS